MDNTNDKPAEKYTSLGVQAEVRAVNHLDDRENPTGGGVNLRFGDRNPIRIQWQNGPRTPDAEGNLAPSNGAFVEDVIWAAIQRLEFFQSSKYESQYNADAIAHLEKALESLNARRKDRADRGVEGQHKV